MDETSFWIPAPAWCRMSADMLCDEQKSVQLVDPFQPSHYSHNGQWSDMGSPSAPDGVTWYASTTDSEGPRTSDFSPSSGYFDWNHSSNNTSPMQCDEIVGQPRPGTIHYPSHAGGLEQFSPFVADHRNVRRSSCQDALSTSNSQHRDSFVGDYNDSERVIVSGEHQHDVHTVLPVRTASVSRAGLSSEKNATGTIQEEESGNARSGKRWKAAHRAVERRYRSNLNLKIIKLGQCIPALRSQVGGIDDVEDPQECRTTSKAKLQKGHVLSEAVDYILSLQQQVSDLEAENRQLESRVEALHLRVEDPHGPSEMGQCSWSPGTPRRSSEPHTSLGSKSNKRLSTVPRIGAGREAPSSEAQLPLPPDKNGFSFVSENPSLNSKRPRVGKGGPL